MDRRTRVSAILLGICSLIQITSLAACSSRRTSRDGDARPNVVLISIDTLRSDHVGCYGYARDTSPFIDALARDGVRFHNAYAQASWTLPSHMSIMTSLHPQSHGVETVRRSLPESATTLAECLHRAGYSTNAFVSWIYVGRKFGFSQGFDRFRELFPEKRPSWSVDRFLRASVRAEVVVEEVIAWARAMATEVEPFFVFVHLYDPHIPYDPPAEYARMFNSSYVDSHKGSYRYLKPHIRGLHPDAAAPSPSDLQEITALYDSEIRYTDGQVERLISSLDSVGVLENSMVIVTSDHGEELGDHGSMEGHQWTLYEEVLRVPLIIRFPHGEHGGRRIDARVGLIDIAPTILSFLGIDVPADFEGTDLVPLLEEPLAPGRESLTFAEIKRFDAKWSVRDDRYKLIFTVPTYSRRHHRSTGAGHEFYDLLEDPLEREDRFDPSLPVCADMMGVLRRRASRAVSLPTSPGPELSQEEKSRLESLGYKE